MRRHAGVDRPDNQCVNGRPLRRQLGAQAVASSTHRELRRAIAAHVWNSDDAPCRQYVDHCAAAIGLEDRCEGPDHRDRAEIVGLDLLAHGGVVFGSEQGDIVECAGVVDQQIDIGGDGRGGRDLLGLRHVELDRDRSGIGLRRTFGVGQSPCCDIDFPGSGIEQLSDKALANAPISTGDQSRAVLDLHSFPAVPVASM